MRKISTSEMLQIRELLQMESNAAAKAQSVQNMVKDEELKTQMLSGVQASEARIKGIQQFITENNIISAEVH